MVNEQEAENLLQVCQMGCGCSPPCFRCRREWEMKEAFITTLRRLRQQNHDFASNYEKKNAPRMSELAEYRSLDKYVIEEVIGRREYHPSTRMAINTYSIAQQAAVRNLVRERNALLEGFRGAAQIVCANLCNELDPDPDAKHHESCLKAQVILKVIAP